MQVSYILEAATILLCLFSGASVSFEVLSILELTHLPIFVTISCPGKWFRMFIFRVEAC